MNDAEADPWVRTLALRLRAIYAGDARPDPRAEVEQEGLVLQLAQRIAALQRVGPTRYRLGAIVAQGGMGQVVSAVDTVVGRTVAIKRATATCDPRESVRHKLRLLAEAATIARLQHPGVVPLHDVGVDTDGEPFFAMQMVAGGSLADRLATLPHGRRASAHLVEILRRIAETMAYAHGQGVVHRDLKPANIMVGTYGEVYVMDWGLADADVQPAGGGLVGLEAGIGNATLTRSGSVLGTPAYMAPERLVPGATTTPSADIYSLGAILYEVLVGAPPYLAELGAGAGTEEIARMLARVPSPVRVLAPDADPELAAIAERAMQRDVGQRYADMHEFAADLRAWAEHRVVQAHRTGTWEHLRKWMRRNRTIVASIAVALTSMAVGGAWFVARLAEARDVAAAAATAARQSLTELLDLAVTEQISDLRRRADAELWPLTPANGDAMTDWLAQAEALRPVRARLLARREQLDRAALPREPERDGDEPWRRRLLVAAIAALDEFFAPLPAALSPLPLGSTFAAVQMRLARGQELMRATLGEPALGPWQRAAAEVRRTSVYAGLALQPQAGLVPLGMDPRSGLQEFAHVASGRVPLRAADGSLGIESRDCIVLVLLPGGDVWTGATPDDPRHRDPQAETINEGPVHEMRLAPFFLAKFETTQAQWQYMTGENPSVHTEASDFVDARAPRHPVESVDWSSARTLAHKMGLCLPTETQWEYAARAGTTTPWYAGATMADLLQPPAGNLADEGSTALGTQSWARMPGLDDGFVMHAPVGTFGSNGFGLYDMIGNVAEWCDDEYMSYATAGGVGTGGRRLSDAPRTAMYRGGAFDLPAQEARSANRAGAPPGRRHFGLGVRFARALAP
ncbi:MAG: bifunctional serine/threonine-protein kinase/formylglycine-generating enzyme family protein [Planctomycetes bacterium]|nr:bifunctional serine/threonine-protein kinase/formylglycine-generating enzyme family protein [Planctomycetota bacterium]